MASLFRPIAVKQLLLGAVVTLKNKKKIATWVTRNGEKKSAEIDSTGTKIRVRSPFWWVEYNDAGGRRKRKRLSQNRNAAIKMMGEIVDDVERQRGGLAPMSSAVTFDTIEALAVEFRQHLRSQGRSPAHFNTTYRQVVAVAEECKWIRIQDVTPVTWSRWVNSRIEVDLPISAETINHYLRSLRGFFRWLIRSNRLGADPLAAVGLMNADADRRIKRRVLSPVDLRQLIASARASTVEYSGLAGPDRAALYLTASRTGFRAGTLAKLCPEDFRFHDAIASVTSEANEQKNKKGLTLPLSAETVSDLKPWVESRPRGSLLWPGKWHSQGRGSRIIRWDLRDAGLPLETEAGTYDFHALRGQCGTDLAMAGVPLAITQQFLGHSTPVLTAKYYVRVGLSDLAGAANKLGSELGRNSAEGSGILGTQKGKREVKKALKTRSKSKKTSK